MPDTDPGSLDRLHDIVVPPAVPWWPPAPAWYAVIAIGCVLIAVLVWQLVAWWNRNRYRRAALRELDRLGANAPLAAVAELVKRVALAAFPRERVAALSGDAWLRFLDASIGATDFAQGAGRALGGTEYAPGAHPATPELVAVVRHWISHHRADPSC
jgi:hypothetical protein